MNKKTIIKKAVGKACGKGGPYGASIPYGMTDKSPLALATGALKKRVENPGLYNPGTGQRMPQNELRGRDRTTPFTTPLKISKPLNAPNQLPLAQRGKGVIGKSNPNEGRDKLRGLYKLQAN